MHTQVTFLFKNIFKILLKHRFVTIEKNQFIFSRPCGVVGSPAFIEASPILLEQSNTEHLSSPEKHCWLNIIEYY